MISILIVNWNTRELLRACLLSLQATCGEIEHEIIVIDNASKDDSATMVECEFPGVNLIASSENLGFAAGNNRAFEMARGEFIWLLNPDTEVLGDAARTMREFLKTHERCGAVASMLVDAKNGRPQLSCRTFPSPAALWTEAFGLAKFYARSRRFGFYRMGWWNYRDARPVEQPMASSLMLKRAAIQSSGGLFDEDFPIFFNDVDLCWRLWHSGWQIWYLPDAAVLHHGGGATSQARPAMVEQSHRSLRRFYEKHYRGEVWPPLFWATMTMIELAGWWRRMAVTNKNEV